jgi:FAD/FMN-containing dehydrogenase
VQARSGGHSYAAFGLGGADGGMVVDLKAFNGVRVDGK